MQSKVVLEPLATGSEHLVTLLKAIEQKRMVTFEYVSFYEPIPNTIAYIHHEGQTLVGTFDKIKVGDKVRIRFFDFATTVTEIDYDKNIATVTWTDNEGNNHTETDSIDEYVKIV